MQNNSHPNFGDSNNNPMMQQQPQQYSMISNNHNQQHQGAPSGRPPSHPSAISSPSSSASMSPMSAGAGAGGGIMLPNGASITTTAHPMNHQCPPNHPNQIHRLMSPLSSHPQSHGTSIMPHNHLQQQQQHPNNHNHLSFNHHANSHQMQQQQHRERMQMLQQHQNHMHAQQQLQASHHQQHQQQQNQQLQCFKCGKMITDRHLLKALDHFWHEDCLRCTVCNCRLGEVGFKLYQKANQILCKIDYYRMFGQPGTCSGCGKVIPAYEEVMRARNNNYHVKCFICVICKEESAARMEGSTSFAVGDKFYISLDNRILCERHEVQLTNTKTSNSKIKTAK